MNYIILNGTGALELCEAIFKYEKEGYKLQGGISIAFDNQNRKYFAQAMIREKK